MTVPLVYSVSSVLGRHGNRSRVYISVYTSYYMHLSRSNVLREIISRPFFFVDLQVFLSHLLYYHVIFYLLIRRYFYSFMEFIIVLLKIPFTCLFHVLVIRIIHGKCIFFPSFYFIYIIK